MRALLSAAARLDVLGAEFPRACGSEENRGTRAARRLWRGHGCEKMLGGDPDGRRLITRDVQDQELGPTSYAPKGEDVAGALLTQRGTTVVHDHMVARFIQIADCHLAKCATLDDAAW